VSSDASIYRKYEYTGIVSISIYRIDRIVSAASISIFRPPDVSREGLKLYPYA